MHRHPNTDRREPRDINIVTIHHSLVKSNDLSDLTMRLVGRDILFAVVIGSMEFGFSKPTSDLDLCLVYKNTTSDLVRCLDYDHKTGRDNKGEATIDFNGVRKTVGMDIQMYDFRSFARRVYDRSSHELMILSSGTIIKDSPSRVALQEIAAVNFNPAKYYYDTYTSAVAQLRGIWERRSFPGDLKNLWFVYRLILQIVYVLGRNAYPPVRIDELNNAITSRFNMKTESHQRLVSLILDTRERFMNLFSVNVAETENPKAYAELLKNFNDLFEICETLISTLSALEKDSLSVLTQVSPLTTPELVNMVVRDSLTM